MNLNNYVYHFLLCYPRVILNCPVSHSHSVAALHVSYHAVLFTYNHVKNAFQFCTNPAAWIRFQEDVHFMFSETIFPQCNEPLTYVYTTYLAINSIYDSDFQHSDIFHTPTHTWVVFCLWTGTSGGLGSGTSPSCSGPGRPSWSVCPGSDSLIGCLTGPET